MKILRWDPEKSRSIANNSDRGVSLEVIAELIQSGSVLAIEKRVKYPDQNCFIVRIVDDIWCVPFREEDDFIYLMTAWPDRKFKKKYSQ